MPPRAQVGPLAWRAHLQPSGRPSPQFKGLGGHLHSRRPQKHPLTPIQGRRSGGVTYDFPLNRTGYVHKPLFGQRQRARHRPLPWPDMASHGHLPWPHGHVRSMIATCDLQSHDKDIVKKKGVGGANSAPEG